MPDTPSHRAHDSLAATPFAPDVCIGLMARALAAFHAAGLPRVSGTTRYAPHAHVALVGGNATVAGALLITGTDGAIVAMTPFDIQALTAPATSAVVQADRLSHGILRHAHTAACLGHPMGAVVTEADFARMTAVRRTRATIEGEALLGATLLPGTVVWVIVGVGTDGRPTCRTDSWPATTSWATLRTLSVAPMFGERAA
jgi:hypothetical protein